MRAFALCAALVLLLSVRVVLAQDRPPTQIYYIEDDQGAGGPSLKETLTWLQGKIGPNSPDENVETRLVVRDREDHDWSDHWYSQRVLSFTEGGSLRLRTREWGYGYKPHDPSHDTTMELQVSLGELNPKVKVRKWTLSDKYGEQSPDFVYSLQLEGRNGRHVFKCDYWYGSETGGTPGNLLGEHHALLFDGVELTFAEKELTDRIAKALSHAIKLCGGKAEPF